jgi:hypothetical protein
MNTPTGKPKMPSPQNTTTAVMAPTLNTDEARFLPPKIILNCVEGWGKPTCAAYCPKPAIVMARGETGYETLLGTDSVPLVPRTLVNTWPELMAFLDAQIEQDALAYKTLALDALGGIERLCHEYVCQRDFRNDWGEKGFSSFQKGYEVAVADWLKLLHKLDHIHSKGVMILLLGHTQIKPFKNPMGEDFDRYISDIHHKTWGVTHKWADAAFFGTYLTIVDKISGRAKGIGGADRVIYTQRRDAFDAKNRYGMPEEISIPNDPAQIWSTLWHYLYQRKDS